MFRMPLRSGLATIAILLVTACGGDSSEADTASSRANVVNGHQFHAQGQYRAALIEGQNAIKSAPQDPGGYVLLATISNSLGQYRQSIAALEAVKGTTPDYLFTLADAYIGTRKFYSAAEVLTEHEAVLLGNHTARFHNLSAEIDRNLRDLPAARAHFDAALASDPSNNAAQLGLARLEWEVGNQGTAQDKLSALLQRAPDYVPGLVARASFALQSDDVDIAESSLSAALAALPTTDIFTPERTEILVALKNVLTKQGRTAEALTYAQMLSEAFPGSQETESAMREAVALFEEGKLNEARAVLEKLQEDNPGVAAASTLLGVINFMQGNNEQASEQFDQVLDPETAPARTLQIYALNELRLNQPERVLDAMGPTIKDSQDASLVGLYGVAAISAGRAEEGVEALKRAVALDPEKARFRLLLARYYNTRSAPEPDKALVEVEAALAISPEDPFVQTAILEQLGLMGRLKAADAAVTKMLKDYPEVAATHQIAGTHYFRVNDFQTALKHFASAVKLAPTDERGLFGMGRANLELKNYAAASTNFRDIININADNTQAYKGFITAAELNKAVTPAIEQIEREAKSGTAITPFMVLAEYYARNGKDAETDAMLEQATIKMPESNVIRNFKVALSFNRGQRALLAGEYNKGREAIMSGLDIEADSERLLGTLVDIEIKAGNAREAETLLDRLAETHPDSNVVPLLRGDLSLSRQNLTAAAGHFREAFDQQPSDTAAFKLYGVLRQGVGPGSSDTVLNDWEEKLPTSTLMKITRAGRYMELGNNIDARKIYELVIQTAPNSVIALNNLAWIYLEDNLKAAAEVAKRAYDLASNNGDVVDTYGWVLLQQGNVQEAVTILEQAATLEPDNEDIKGHLRDARARL